MVKSYAMEKLMGYLIKYMQGFMLMSCQMWDVEEDDGVSGEVLKGIGRSVDSGRALWNIAHHYVFTNTTTMIVWVKC
jgi:hypothetical protein